MVDLLDDEVAAVGGGDFDPRPDPAITAQVRQIEELSVGKEPPDPDEVMEDWKWIGDQDMANTFDPTWKYGGQFIAVYNKRIVGSDPDELALRIRLAQELGVHPGRPVLTYQCSQD